MTTPLSTTAPPSLFSGELAVIRLDTVSLKPMGEAEVSFDEVFAGEDIAEHHEPSGAQATEPSQSASEKGLSRADCDDTVEANLLPPDEAENSLNVPQTSPVPKKERALEKAQPEQIENAPVLAASVKREAQEAMPDVKEHESLPLKASYGFAAQRERENLHQSEFETESFQWRLAARTPSALLEANSEANAQFPRKAAGLSEESPEIEQAFLLDVSMSKPIERVKNVATTQQAISYLREFNQIQAKLPSDRLNDDPQITIPERADDLDTLKPVARSADAATRELDFADERPIETLKRTLGTGAQPSIAMEAGQPQAQVQQQARALEHWPAKEVILPLSESVSGEAKPHLSEKLLVPVQDLPRSREGVTAHFQVSQTLPVHVPQIAPDGLDNKHDRGKEIAELHRIEAFWTTPHAALERSSNSVMIHRPQSLNAEKAVVIVREAIDAMAASKQREIELQLHPKELGRLRFVMSPGEGQMLVQVFADRSETLDAMRRQVEVLARELLAEGFENTSFAFNQAPQSPSNEADNAPSKEVFLEGPEPTIQTGRQAWQNLDARLDIRI